VWGQHVKRGVTAWGDSPSDVQVGKWLPIFMEGVREYEVSEGGLSESLRVQQ